MWVTQMYLADNVSDNTAELLQSLCRKLHDSLSPAVSISGRDLGARILRAGRDRTKNNGGSLSDRCFIFMFSYCCHC